MKSCCNKNHNPGGLKKNSGNYILRKSSGEEEMKSVMVEMAAKRKDSLDSSETNSTYTEEEESLIDGCETGKIKKEKQKLKLWRGKSIFEQWQDPLNSWLEPLMEWQMPVCEWQQPLVNWQGLDRSRSSMRATPQF